MAYTIKIGRTLETASEYKVNSDEGKAKGQTMMEIIHAFVFEDTMLQRTGDTLHITEPEMVNVWAKTKNGDFKLIIRYEMEKKKRVRRSR